MDNTADECHIDRHLKYGLYAEQEPVEGYTPLASSFKMLSW